MPYRRSLVCVVVTVLSFALSFYPRLVRSARLFQVVSIFTPGLKVQRAGIEEH